MESAGARSDTGIAAGAAKWRPVDGLLIEEIGNDVLVLNKSVGRIHQFNHTAGIVWRGLMKGDTLDQIAAKIVERFDVPDFRATKDAERMIEQLRILKLITSDAGGIPPGVVSSQQDRKANE